MCVLYVWWVLCFLQTKFDAEFGRRLAKRWVLNPRCSRIIKSPNLVPVRICPDLSRLVQWLSRSPGPGQWLSRSPEPVQDLSSGCPGRQDLLDKKNYLCMSEKVFFSFPRMFVFSFSFSRYPYYVFFLYISGEQRLKILVSSLNWLKPHSRNQVGTRVWINTWESAAFRCIGL